jgi:hypothetical protein
MWKLPAGVASMVNYGDGEWHTITFADIGRGKRERQRRRLELRRNFTPWSACRLWVAYFDQRLMGGWQAFLKDRRGECWIDRDRKHAKERLMELFQFPSLFPLDWHDWKAEFAVRHQVCRHDGRPLGAVNIWQCGNRLEAAIQEGH